MRILQRRTRKILKSYDIVIATASPRRRELIRKIAFVNPIFMPADVAEETLSDADATARVNARKKGEYISARTDLPVLAFDTVVGLDNKVFGKPDTAEHAVKMFRTLCGRTHEVVTAVYFNINGKTIEKSEKTFVTFGAFRKDLVYNYIDSGASFDKAGGYNIDDPEINGLITAVDGDRDNVVGLPVKLTEKLLEEYLIYGEDGYRA